MISLSFINPLDQPTGRKRLLPQLIDSLQDDQFRRFRLIVAFAKVGPLLRMASVIDARRSKGVKIEALFGVDQRGTSAQALTFALDHFDHVYVTREPNLTFHPKMYVFDGPKSGRLFVGSNNLTVGGTETNFEAAVCVDLALPEDAGTFQQFGDCWNELLPTVCPATNVLNRALLADYVRDGTVPDETAMRWRGGASGGLSIPKAPRSGLKVLPPSSQPARNPAKTVGTTTASSPAVKGAVAAAVKVAAAAKAASDPYSAQGLAIQIKPHHNGEIFLSVTAALQNPAFFKWPFTGLTIPKKGSNTAYPQLTPDPRVNLTVYGAKLAPLLTLTDYALNTVYYERKSEIRITASQLVGVVPDYSVMIMRQSDSHGIDYDIVVHTPASPDFLAWVAACNQRMPGGGKTPRKFGWF